MSLFVGRFALGTEEPCTYYAELNPNAAPAAAAPVSNLAASEGRTEPVASPGQGASAGEGITPIRVPTESSGQGLAYLPTPSTSSGQGMNADASLPAKSPVASSVEGIKAEPASGEVNIPVVLTFKPSTPVAVSSEGTTPVAVTPVAVSSEGTIPVADPVAPPVSNHVPVVNFSESLPPTSHPTTLGRAHFEASGNGHELVLVEELGPGKDTKLRFGRFIETKGQGYPEGTKVYVNTTELNNGMKLLVHKNGIAELVHGRVPGNPSGRFRWHDGPPLTSPNTPNAKPLFGDSSSSPEIDVPFLAKAQPGSLSSTLGSKLGLSGETQAQLQFAAGGKAKVSLSAQRGSERVAFLEADLEEVPDATKGQKKFRFIDPDGAELTALDGEDGKFKITTVITAFRNAGQNLEYNGTWR